MVKGDYIMLKEKIESLFEELDSSHALLTPRLFDDEETRRIIENKCPGFYKASFKKECNSQKYGLSKEISVGQFKLYKHHVITRCLRKNDELLFELGIKKRNAEKYYEYDPCLSSPYIFCIDESYKNRLPPEIREKLRKATVFKYDKQNPKGKLITVDLQSKDGFSHAFNITANWAPFCKNHFVVFAHNNGNSVLKQIFHKNETLYWIDDLFTQLDSAEYGLFYNPQNAGNSMDTKHFQLVKNSFPVFEALKRSYPNMTPGLIHTNKYGWPFKGILARYTLDTKDRVLSSLEKEICLWIANSKNNFNLLFSVNQNGYREFFFVFRQNGLNYAKGISNGIAGYEIGGHLIIEEREEYENFSDKSEKLEMCEKP
jgi:hypothetical protein